MEVGEGELVTEVVVLPPAPVVIMLLVDDDCVLADPALSVAVETSLFASEPAVPGSGLDSCLVYDAGAVRNSDARARVGTEVMSPFAQSWTRFQPVANSFSHHVVWWIIQYMMNLVWAPSRSCAAW